MNDFYSKRSLGQNFLIDKGIILRIVEKVYELQVQSWVEVGPGPGALTQHLLKKDKPLLLVELDQRFSQMWKEQGCEVIEQDVLQVQWNKLHLQSPVGVVGNLPYQVAARLMIELSMGVEQVSAMLFMMQKEVAGKVQAFCKNKDYGLLSVIVQSFWETEFLLEAAPHCFKPVPKVAGRVIVFQKKESALKNKKSYLKMVRQAFSHRRKKLWRNLNMCLGQGENVWKGILIEMGKTENTRAEELSPKEFQELFCKAQG